MNLLFIFIDGLGLGENHSANPLVCAEMPGLTKLLEGKRLVAETTGFSGSQASLLGLDARLGVEGLPQSATGQATIFTGVNAPAKIGAHMNGFPDSHLRQLLAAKGIFLQLRNLGFQVSFANAYRPPFFDMLSSGLPGNNYSCSTLITYYGGLIFKTLECLSKGQALYMDITNNLLVSNGYDVPVISPEAGARNLVNLSRGFHFCLFEYFLSDLVGHEADKEGAMREVLKLDRFISSLAGLIDPEETFIIVTSDHGNLEDLSSREHTLNPVPALLIGSWRVRKIIEPALKDLTDLLPAVIGVIDQGA